MNPVLVIGVIFGIILSVAYLTQPQKNGCGLNYSIKHLEKIYPDIVFWPIEDQAKYADHVCMHMVSEANIGSLIDRNQLEGSCADALKITDFSSINATGIGNIAYIALNSNDSGIKNASRIFLENAKQYFQKQKAA